ncbi:2,3-bisphosphoglycerate-independent phosphoglycerate mutase [Thiomicrorhabdus aquaedulcis]|uniref:2,3-bisphosphoglycerate-independent phosphoglycerate mutase n=1 Tax=Thiomicrorhabdus aquaedulcis TaxID=2211106 RepID=UPI000FD6ED17|nr:2,3-bisphosphoglycerate-independent phosphoglycerate mutase [Thiomicrorhabdus aquaedulcis]
MSHSDNLVTSEPTPVNTSAHTPKNRPTGLLILDGWGYREEREHNAIAQGNTPNWDQLMATRPHALIHTSGMAVGLPHGQMGNSEVGHTNLGAGRVVYQELTRIQKDIDEGGFFTNPTLIQAIDAAVNKHAQVHIFGLLSDGGVHSHIEHIKAAITLAVQRGATPLVHIFTDGRDTPPQSALLYIAQLEAHLAQTGGRIVSVIGRFYAMDRDNRWERVTAAYNTLCCAQASFSAASAAEAVEAAYARGENDEFVQPTVIINTEPAAHINDGDSVLFMNYRSDRARQLTNAFLNPEFNEFERVKTPVLSHFVTLTEYNKTFVSLGATIAYGPTDLKNTFGEVVSNLNLKQLRIAETEKYAHVTFFLNGGLETPYPGEDRILVPSPQVRTYDLQPEMSVGELTEKLVGAIESGKYDTFICNIANPDMVGHTGNFAACIKAVEAVDEALGKILTAIEKANGQVIVTADHGNIEMLVDPITGDPFTSHTTFPVQCVYVGPRECVLRDGGSLPDVIPTLLDLMDIAKPTEMTGVSLCVNSK